MSEQIDFTSVEQIQGETELTPPETYAANLIEWAIDRHASDLFVSDMEHCVVVSVRRLGKVEVVRRLARTYGNRLQGHLRVLAGADAGETIRPSEGRGVVQTPNGRSVDVRLSSIPTLFGQDVAMRLFDPISGARDIEQLGLDGHELELISELLERQAGLILVAGPVASGKSSTLYAMLDRLNDGTRKIHALEDPIEHAIDNVMQSQVNLKAGLDFADLLSTVLRHSPDVIMIGEIRDSQTAAAAVRAGSSGQLVLATIHAKSSAEAIDSMLHYETNPKFLSSSLIGVINQRLFRRLCTECREEVALETPLQVPERIAPRMGNQEARLYRAKGCETCFGDGFSTLTSLVEIMTVNRELGEAISNGVAANELEKIAANSGMLRLPEVAASRVLRGIATSQEANRVVTDEYLATLAALSK